MTFNIDGFITTQNLIGAVGGTPIREHRYCTNDTKGTIEGAGYFNDLRDDGLITEGDLLGVSGDLDGTPFHAFYVFSSVPASGDVALTEHAAVTQNVLHALTVRVTALGTASNHYVVSPVAGELVAAYGVSNGANGTAPSTIGISIDGGDKATLTFSDTYVAGTAVSDTSVDANTISAGEVILIDNNGEGDGTGEVTVTLLIQP